MINPKMISLKNPQEKDPLHPKITRKSPPRRIPLRNQKTIRSGICFEKDSKTHLNSN
jgi:hypothetical protein